jgi:hypothetical protein
MWQPAVAHDQLAQNDNNLRGEILALCNEVSTFLP